MKKIATVLMFAAGVLTAQDGLLKVEKAELSPDVLKSRFSGSSQSQAGEKTNAALVQDTLWYHLNKHVYRNQSYGGFYVLKAPSPSTFAVTHFGAKFIKSSPEPLVISGLEMLASRVGSSPSPSVPVTIILCNLDANGNFVLPGIDSVSALVATTFPSVTVVSGNFAQPKIVTGNFAIVYRNASTNPQDTIRAWMNNALTAASTSTANHRKYGEGLGMIRFKVGTMSAPVNTVTTGLFIAADTDFEFLVAPRVSFSLSTSANHSTTASCNNTVVFTPSITPGYATSQFFNLIEFTNVWGPFTGTIGAPTPSGQAMYNWNVGGTTPTSTNMNTTTTYTTNANYPVSLNFKYLKMNDFGILIVDTYSATVSVTDCPTYVGELSLAETVNVFPNPASAQLHLRSDRDMVQYSLVNMLGEILQSGMLVSGNNTLDVSSLKSGIYFIRLQSGDKQSTIKFMKE